MEKSKVAMIISGALAIMVIVFVVSMLLIKTLWAWTIPDLFPGAVEQGLIAGSLSRIAFMVYSNKTRHLPRGFCGIKGRRPLIDNPTDAKVHPAKWSYLHKCYICTNIDSKNKFAHSLFHVHIISHICYSIKWLF